MLPKIYYGNNRSTFSVCEVIKATMAWHFSEETGSPFWLSKKRQLGFNPLKDVHSVADLDLFPDFIEEWRHVHVRDLIPRGLQSCERWEFEVYETGGTTGKPHRIVDMASCARGLDWVDAMLTRHGVPGEDGGDWLHVGPTGPHIVGRSISRLARRRRRVCFLINFDPRWVKRCLRAGRSGVASDYVKHIIVQAEDVLRSQDIGVVFATPAVLEAMCEHRGLYRLLREKVKAILWAGTSIGAETLHLLREELFEGLQVVGLYGNTFMGIAPQRPPSSQDPSLCVFQSWWPFSIIRVVRPEAPDRLVNYGQRGQAKITLLTPEVFVPGHLERDELLRVCPTAEFPWDGVAEVKPIAQPGVAVIEGVY